MQFAGETLPCLLGGIREAGVVALPICVPQLARANPVGHEAVQVELLVVWVGCEETAPVEAVQCALDLKCVLQGIHVVVWDGRAIQGQSLQQTPVIVHQDVVVEIGEQYVFDPLFKVGTMPLIEPYRESRRANELSQATAACS